VVVIENQVNVGNNSLKVVKALRNNGCKVLGIVTIFDYGFPSTHRKLEKEGIDLTALTNLETILHHAENMNVINDEQRRILEAWQHRPSNWNK
jgi:orotate phosphoribosyltransferase